MISLNDIWIAAFAVRDEISLLARDGHFERIDGLNLIALKWLNSDPDQQVTDGRRMRAGALLPR